MRNMTRCLIGLLPVLLWLAIGDVRGESSRGPTPPRLSLIENEVSFWRPGAGEWSAALLNTPLAAGDELSAGEAANLEVQIGARAFVRAGEKSRLGLRRLDSRLLRFRVDEGHVSFDLRSLLPGLIVEVETTNALFTIEHSGYYRFRVDQDSTVFSTRRGGRALLIPEGGAARAIAPAEEVEVEGERAPQVHTYVVPELDDWDRWNYARTDQLVDALSARYLPPDVYGAEALDRHGQWRVDPTYGALWYPAGVAAGWAPYSLGRWIWDPFYGWTWIDQAAWGWVPFHYGRWVLVGSFWAWAPGPVAVRSAYSPALVAFFGGEVALGIGIGGPLMSWVALSWGEPLLPWWGQRGFVGVPWWGGWYGPRVVSGRAYPERREHRHFRNATAGNAVVVVRQDEFGRGPVSGRVFGAGELAQGGRWTPLIGALPVRPVASSLMTGDRLPAQPFRAPRRAERGEGDVGRPSAAVNPPSFEAGPRPKTGHSGGKPTWGKPLRHDQAVAERPPVPTATGRPEGPERAPPPPLLRFQEGRRFGGAPDAGPLPGQLAPGVDERRHDRRAEKSDARRSEVREEERDDKRSEKKDERNAGRLMENRPFDDRRRGVPGDEVRDERRLPGQPANRMSPRRRGEANEADGR